jgi:hypothetical protein
LPPVDGDTTEFGFTREMGFEAAAAAAAMPFIHDLT